VPCATHHATNKVYCANNTTARISVLDGGESTNHQSWCTGSLAALPLLQPRGQQSLCGKQQSATPLCVVDGTSNGVLAVVALGTIPSPLCHDPLLQTRSTASTRGSASVTVIDGSKHRDALSQSSGRRPRAMSESGEESGVRGKLRRFQYLRCSRDSSRVGIGRST